MSKPEISQECALARALMPLEIEGAASEESARYVKEHIAACTDCAIAYGEEKQRQRQALQDAAAREGERFRREMRQLKKRRTIRKALAILGAIALALGLMTGGFGLNTFLNCNYQFYVSPDEYSLALYRLEDGSIMAQYIFQGDPFDLGLSERLEDGVLRLASTTTAIRHPLAKAPLVSTDCRWEDGKLYAAFPDQAQGVEITRDSITNGRRGDRMVETTIWTRGEDIPPLAKREE